VALGGGWPAGRLCVISGRAGLGKDYLANRTIATLQDNYGDDARVFIASYGTDHDARFAQQCGVAFPMSESDIKKLEKDRGKPYAPNLRKALQYEIGKIVIPKFKDCDAARMNPAGWMAALVLKLIQSGVFQVGILNEIGSEVTRDMLESGTKKKGKKSEEEKAVSGDFDSLKRGSFRRTASRARFMDEFMARYCLVMKQSTREYTNETSLLLLSQVRTHVSSFGSWLESVGGEHLRHVKSIELFMSEGKPITASGSIIGKNVKWKLTKGKHGTHDGISGSFNFIDGRGVNLAEDLVNEALEAGVISRDPPYFSWRDIKVLGKRAFIKAVNGDVMKAMRKDMFDCMGLMVRVR